MRGVRRLLTVTALTAVFLANVSVVAAAAGVTISVDSAYITNANQASFHVHGSADIGVPVDLTISDGVHTPLTPSTTGQPGDVWSINVDLSSLADEATVTFHAHCGLCGATDASTTATKDTTTVAFSYYPEPITPTDTTINGIAEFGDTVSIDVTDGTHHVPGSTTSDGTWAFSALDMTSLNHSPATITITVTATDAHSTATGTATTTKTWTPAKPAAPTADVSAHEYGKATVTWVAPDNGGLAIDHYTVKWYWDSTSSSKTCTGLSCDVTGLINGTSYTFTVAANNSIGNGPESNASSAVVPSTQPAKPAAPTALHHDTYVAVTWSPPTDDGGSAITGYHVKTYEGASEVGGKTCDGGGGDTTCDVTGLTNGHTYTFTVTAANANGNSPESNHSGGATPSKAPGKPDAPGVSPSNQKVTVSWIAPDDGGAAIDGYTVKRYIGASLDGSTPCASSPCDVTGLTNGTSYTFTVTAHNVDGDSTESNQSTAAIPYTTPDQPAAPTGVHHDTYVTVSWIAPNDEGRAIDHYTIKWYWGASSSDSKTCTGLSCDVTGLTNGTAYTFTVTAHNLAGDSLESSASAAVTPSKLPAKPAAPTVARGNAHVNVYWDAPDDGGATIDHYTVKWYWGASSSDSKSCASSPCDVTGLTNGTAYTFTVTAHNVDGDGPESDHSVSVTPRVAVEPGKPLSATAIGLDGTARVSWTAPVDDGGHAITSYTVTAFDHAGADTGKRCTITSPFDNGLVCTFAAASFDNYDSYKFSVTATNDIGTGLASDKTPWINPRPGDTFMPVVPNRVLSSHVVYNGQPGSAASYTFPVTGQSVDPTKNIPVDAVAVTGVLSVTSPTYGGYLALTPAGVGDVSTLNVPKGDGRSTGVTLPLGPNVGGVRSLNVAYVSAGSAAQHATVNFDVTGYFVVGTSGSTYYAVPPTRVLSTRDYGTPRIHLTSGSPVTFKVIPPTQSGNDPHLPSEIDPATVTAVTGNLTITNQRSVGVLTVGPVAETSPGTATILTPGYDNRATGVTVKVSSSQTLSVTWVGSGTADAIFDVNGYFTTNSGGAMYVPVTPNRIFDTRAKTAAYGAIGSPRQLHVTANRCTYFNVVNLSFVTDPAKKVPAGASAVTGILTVVGQSYPGFFALLSANASKEPGSSTLNFLRDTRATGVTVPLSDDGSGRLYLYFASTKSGRADALFDVSGYFIPIPS